MVQKQIGRYQLILNSAVGSTISPMSSNRSADSFLSNVHKAPSPRGTPLQFAWRCFHSPELDYDTRAALAGVMKGLVENGANTNWTEPNGTNVNKVDVMAWCAVSHPQLTLQSEFDCAFCRLSRDMYEYPLYATRSQVEIYKRTLGFLHHRGSEEGLDIEDHAISESALVDGDLSGSQDSV